MQFHVFLVMACAVSLAQTQSMQAQSMQPTGAEESSPSVGYDQVREILRKRCVTCHNPDEMRGDLDLKNMTAIMAGSSSGPVAVAGKSNLSLLYTAAAHLADPKMPPNSPKIPARELDLLRRWIDGGLVEKSGDNPTHTSVQENSQGDSTSDASTFAAVRGVLQPSAIAAIDAHPLNDLVAFAGSDQVVLMESDSGKMLGGIDFPDGEVTAIRFSRDGKTLVVAGGVAALSGKVVGFEVATGRKQFELADETDSILALDISPDGSLVAVGGPSKVVRIYRVSDGAVVHTLRKHTDWVLSARFSPDGLLLASGDRFGGLFVWNPDTGEEFHSLKGHTGPVTSVAWDLDGETLLSAGEDGKIRTWNMHHGQQTSQWNGEAGAVLSMARSSQATYCGGRDRRLVAWQSPEIQIASSDFADQIDQVVSVSASGCVVASDASGGLQVLDAETLQVKHRVSLPKSSQLLDDVFARLDSAEQEYVALRREQRTESNDISQSDVETSDFDTGTIEKAFEPALNASVLQQQLTLATEHVQQIADSLASLEAAKSSIETQIAAQRQHLDDAQQLVQSLLVLSPDQRTALLESKAQQEQLLQAANDMYAQLRLASDSKSMSPRAASLLMELTNEFQQSLAATKTALGEDYPVSRLQSKSNVQ